ncbi:DUF6916 family protein [Emticicia sp.]|uniref:DUF6916 family protein n=1 Tax=Emticicia sp. TaxID=1930953 RepID=UPI003753B4E2
METQELKHVLDTDFAPYLNQKLNIGFSQEITLSAELIAVTKLGGYSPLERNPFSIVLRTEQKTEYYQQGTYIIQHPSKGEMLIFLVPLGLDKEGMKYEAIFS